MKKNTWTSTWPCRNSPHLGVDKKTDNVDFWLLDVLGNGSVDLKSYVKFTEVYQSRNTELVGEAKNGNGVFVFDRGVVSVDVLEHGHEDVVRTVVHVDLSVNEYNYIYRLIEWLIDCLTARGTLMWCNTLAFRSWWVQIRAPLHRPTICLCLCLCCIAKSTAASGIWSHNYWQPAIGWLPVAAAKITSSLQYPIHQ